jgi:hypothetical protein
MKRLLTAAACAALFVAPALAQNVPAGAGPSAPAPSAAADCPTLPDSSPDQPCPANVGSGAAGSGAASLSLSAVPSEATGTITGIDVAAGTVTLDDGKNYAMHGNLALNSFGVGQRVTISFLSQEGKLMATDVKPATSEEPPEPPVPLENRY